MSAPDSEMKAAIKRCLRVLHPPGSVFEIRAPKVRSRGKLTTISGYFNDHEAAVAAALELDQRSKVPGIYVTLNAINPRLLERSPNRLTDNAEHTTADRDVQRRCWLPVDLDPALPAGIAATAAETHVVADRARAVASWMRDHGLSEPVVASSGNGIWLLYPVHEPNDDASATLFKNVLRTLDRWFSDDAVKIDQSVWNAARIVRLFGTTNRKGNGQSRSRILQLPTDESAR